MAFSVNYNVGWWHTNTWGSLQVALNNHIGYYNIIAINNENGGVLAAARYSTNSKQCTSVVQLGDRFNAYITNNNHWVYDNQINCTCNYSNQLIFYYSFLYNSVNIRIDYIGTASSKTGELWAAIYPGQNIS